MANSPSATEKERREEKELQKRMKEAFARWSKPDAEGNYPIDDLDNKDKARFMMAQMPKPVAVDQEFEASLISLGAMLADLPDPVDKAADLQALRGRERKLKADLKIQKMRADTFKKRSDEKSVEWWEIVEAAFREGQYLRAENKAVAEALGITVSDFAQMVASP